ncbi:hypothetical protein I204_04394 [Kwoniella mangroviensis CBS 8886]|uniref:uncharacterized protein n=1 Tax=Kwoniella mangroviensis CBS 8507 TaxID=1296122 RepID=UPI00080D1D8F|nr:uncharacterized protein I203_03097 [Kwoniella mangroviensis CBS 8507]OCF67403.1 hypothetical protein I203_03097 [Kwoniella mangroviensis CBS 8507]OCF75538.1 hypothetical protein I204_04394 [Kwoniella mangroviensis CBS 8886]
MSSSSSTSSLTILATPPSPPTSILKSPDSPRSENEKKVRFSEENDYFTIPPRRSRSKHRHRDRSDTRSISSSECSLRKILEVYQSPPASHPRAAGDTKDLINDQCVWGIEEECIGDSYTQSGVERARREREEWLGKPSYRDRTLSFSITNLFDIIMDFLNFGSGKVVDDPSELNDMNEYKITTKRRLFRPTTYSIVLNDMTRTTS